MRPLQSLVQSANLRQGAGAFLFLVVTLFRVLRWSRAAFIVGFCSRLENVLTIKKARSFADFGLNKKQIGKGLCLVFLGYIVQSAAP